MTTRISPVLAEALVALAAGLAAASGGAGVTAAIASSGFISRGWHALRGANKRPKPQLQLAVQTMVDALDASPNEQAQLLALFEDISDTSLASLLDQALQTAAERGQAPDVALGAQLHQALPFDGHSPRLRELADRICGALAQQTRGELREAFIEHALVSLISHGHAQASAQQRAQQNSQAQFDALRDELQRMRNIRGLALTRHTPNAAARTDWVLALDYRHGMTEFLGRETEWQALSDFLNGDDPLRWWQLSGAAGQGKSRLANEFINAADAQWHAGFLSPTELARIDWRHIELHSHTLIVVDYLSVPEHASAWVNMLHALKQRVDQTPADQRLRIRVLALEREAYDLTAAGTSDPGQHWLSPALRTANDRNTLIGLAHGSKALALQDISMVRMGEIAQSWRARREQTPLDDASLNTLLNQIGGQEPEHQRRAWRPLFAILAAEVIDTASAREPKSRFHLNDLLDAVLTQEAHLLGIEGSALPVEAKRLALLANLVGECPLAEWTKQPDFDHAFFGLTPERCIETLTHTAHALGQTQHMAPDAEAFPKLQARSPDLLSEYWVLKTVANLAWSPNDTAAVLAQACKRGLGNYLGFLFRAQEDFPGMPGLRCLRQTTPRLPLPLVIAGHLGLIRSLEAEVVLASADSLGKALIAASQAGHLDVLGMLLDHTSAHFIDQETGTFPLLMAAQNGHTECVKALIDAQANVNASNPNTGSFPLLQAAQNGHTECVKALIDAQADVNASNPNNGTFPLLQAAQEGHTECVKALIDVQANVNASNPNSGTFPLLMAAQNGYAECVKALIDAQADVNASNPNTGSFPLLQAAQNGHTECVKALIDAQANVNQVDHIDGLFPLLQAAQNGHTTCVKALIDAKANVNASNPNNGNFPLLMAAKNGHTTCVKALIDAQANVNASNPNNGTFPLLMAAQNGHTECVKALIDAQADVNASNPNDGTFPLLQAAQNGHTACVKALIDAQANVNARNPNKGTFPLLAAAVFGHLACIELLVEAGAQLEERHPKFGSAEELARSQGHTDVADWLKARATPSA